MLTHDDFSNIQWQREEPRKWVGVIGRYEITLFIPNHLNDAPANYSDFQALDWKGSDAAEIRRHTNPSAKRLGLGDLIGFVEVCGDVAFTATHPTTGDVYEHHKSNSYSDIPSWAHPLLSDPEAIEYDSNNWFEPWLNDGNTFGEPASDIHEAIAGVITMHEDQ